MKSNIHEANKQTIKICKTKKTVTNHLKEISGWPNVANWSNKLILLLKFIGIYLPNYNFVTSLVIIYNISILTFTKTRKRDNLIRIDISSCIWDTTMFFFRFNILIHLKTKYKINSVKLYLSLKKSKRKDCVKID